MFLNFYYLILDLGYQYVDILKNNATPLSSVVINIGTVDMYTLFPYPF